MSRLRLGGLKKTLFLLGKINSQVRAQCNITENAEPVIMHCVKYNKERIHLQ